MKKIFFSLFLLLITVGLSACGSQAVKDQNGALTSLSETANNDLFSADNNSSALDSIQGINKVDEISQVNSVNESVNSNNNMTETTKILPPDQQPDLTKDYSQAIIKTNLGDITVKFYAAESPVTVNNFLNLAAAGFYNGTKFHRIIKDFMIQGGDPLSKEDDARYWGTGGPDYRFQDEFNAKKLVAGSLAMANAGPGTNGSQFFIVTIPETPWLDGKHTNFGQVTGGMDIVKKIEAAETGMNDRPITDIVINSIELAK